MLNPSRLASTFVLTLLAILSVSAVSLDVDSKESVCDAAKYVLDGTLNYYEGLKPGGTVGMFAPPNYWWNAGEAFGGIVDFYTFCNSTNETLRELIIDAMYHQAGENFNYIPSNQSMTEGNDDQGVWVMAIMQAVERNFTNPADHSWLSMTIAAFNTMNARWDTDHCGGGLRWQIFTWNSGYSYKNSVSNGCLFHLAARLARYLGNDTYADVADKVWDWMENTVEFLTDVDGTVTLYDGANIDTNCTDLTKKQWTYTYGIFMAGAAYMYDYTKDEKWLNRVNDLMETSASTFFPKSNGGYMTEIQCFFSNTCNNDQRSFRSLFSRCIGLTMKLVNSTQEVLGPLIEQSAKGAAASCSGGADGITCGMNWASGNWDGIYGLGEQTSALEVMNALIVEEPLKRSADPEVADKIDYNAGLNSHDTVNQNEITVTGKDRAGAGVLTAVVLGILLGGGAWMIF